MDLEEILFELLAGNEELCQSLAVFEGKPAIFHMRPPRDTDLGWENGQYPRIVYYPDLYEDLERKTSGMLEVDIECQGQDMRPREIERLLSHALADTFVQTGGGNTYAFRRKHDEVIRRKQMGADFSSRLYEILEYPCSEAYDPDPVAALENFQRENLTGFLLGKREESFYKVKENEPAYYFRLENVKEAEETFTVIWMEGEIGVHIFSPSRQETLKWMACMSQALAKQGHLELSDGSPMRLVKIEGNYTKDLLTKGQITLSVRFGILKHQERSPVIRNVYFNESI